MQTAILYNVARSQGEEGNWHALLVPMSTLLYIVALGFWAVTRKSSLLRDAYLIAYSGYLALLLGSISSGNFLHQLRMYGVVEALMNHLVDLLYLGIAVAFALDRLVSLLAHQR
jgi:hypothetical protein